MILQTRLLFGYFFLSKLFDDFHSLFTTYIYYNDIEFMDFFSIQNIQLFGYQLSYMTKRWRGIFKKLVKSYFFGELFWILETFLIGWLCWAANQKPRTFKKVCQKGRNMIWRVFWKYLLAFRYKMKINKQLIIKVYKLNAQWGQKI